MKQLHRVQQSMLSFSHLNPNQWNKTYNLQLTRFQEKHIWKLYYCSHLIVGHGQGSCRPPSSLWTVAVKERRWTCSGLVMNCGPDAPLFRYDPVLSAQVVRSNEQETSNSARHAAAAVTRLIAEQISPGIAFWDFSWVHCHLWQSCHTLYQIAIFGGPHHFQYSRWLPPVSGRNF